MTKPSVVTTAGEIVQPAALHKEPRFSDIFPVEVTFGNFLKNNENIVGIGTRQEVGEIIGKT